MVNRRLVQSFDDLVFEIAPDSTGRTVSQHNDRLVRWESDIRYTIIGDETDELGEQALASLGKIAEFAGVPHAKARGWTAVNFKIYLDRKTDYVINGNQSASCYAHTEADSEGRLVKAEIHLPVKRRTTAEACIDHEILHTFGFRGHSHGLRSTMSYVSGEDEWTRWDRLLLRVLYHKDIPTGARRDQALAAAESLIPGLLGQTE